MVIAGSVAKKVQTYLHTSMLDVHSDVFVYDGPLSANSVSCEYIHALRPTYAVYTKAVSKIPQRSVSPKQTHDPLDSVTPEHRFNTKEGSVTIVSDGNTVQVYGNKKEP